MKICLATDFHLSYRQYGLEERENDFYAQYEKLVDAVIEENPNLFLILGDIFDTPYPKPIAIRRFQDGLKRINEKGIPIYCIVGNHTLVQRNNFFPIDNVFDDNLCVLDDDFVIVDDVFIGGLKYHSKTHSIKEIIDELYENAEGCKLKILLLHQILKEDQEIGYDFDEEELELNRFDYVFLGHFHKRLIRQPFSSDTVYHYVGSLNSCSVVELEDEMENGKGYTVFDTDSYMLEMKTLPHCRDYVKFNVNVDELNYDLIDSMCVRLKEYSIKPIVQLNVVSENASDVYEMTKKLEDYCLTLRYKVFKPLATDEVGDYGGFEDGMSIEAIIQSKFDEKWKSDFCFELLQLLSSGDIEGAKGLADDVYAMHFQNESSK